MKTTPMKSPCRQPMLGVLLSGLVFSLASMLRADSATPFLEINNQAGDVSTVHAYVAEITPPSGSRPGSYAVIVLDDTRRPNAMTATAGAGVVPAALLGREVTVRARVVTAGRTSSPPLAGHPPALEILLVAPLTSVAATPTSFKPKDGYVADAPTAIKIAVAVWEPIFGEQEIAGEKPYQASLTNGVWTVMGSLPAGTLGGVAIAEIAKDDGRILRLIHEQ